MSGNILGTGSSQNKHSLSSALSGTYFGNALLWDQYPTSSKLIHGSNWFFHKGSTGIKCLNTIQEPSHWGFLISPPLYQQHHCAKHCSTQPPPTRYWLQSFMTVLKHHLTLPKLSWVYYPKHQVPHCKHSFFSCN